MSEKEEALKEAILDLIADDVDEAIKIMTSYFVGLISEVSRRAGADPDLEIKIETQGGLGRDITIHPKKELVQ